MLHGVSINLKSPKRDVNYRAGLQPNGMLVYTIDTRDPGKAKTLV